MSRKSRIQQLQGHLSVGDLNAFFYQLGDWLNTASSQYNKLFLLQTRWDEFILNLGLGLANPIEKEVVRTEIKEALLVILNRLNEMDLDQSNYADKILAKIFVLTPTAETEMAMRLFFPFTFFTDVDIVSGDTFRLLMKKVTDIHEVNDIFNAPDVVVVDYYNHPEIEISPNAWELQSANLEWMIENTTLNFLWFGPFNKIVSDNNHRIYAANSRFALYARIREMLDFLKYYRVETQDLIQMN